MTFLFAPQKCLDLETELKKKKPQLQGHFMETIKEDGWYAYLTYHAASKSWQPIKKSSMNVCESWKWLYEEKVLDQLPKPNQDAILIAEAIIPGMEFEIMNGLFNRTVGDYSCRDVEFHFHDLIFPNDLRQAYQRWLKVCEFEELLDSKVRKYFKQMDLQTIEDFDKAAWLGKLENVVSRGEEGLVFKRTDSLFYPGKRNSNLIRLKMSCKKDVLVEMVEEGWGEKGNKSYTLICRRKNGVEIRVVMSRHSDIENYLKDASSIVGKVIEVKAMDEFPDGKLRQPVFKRIRFDKLPGDID